MIYFTKYAEKKFSLLNDHSVFIRKEEVEMTLASPDIRGVIGKYHTAQKDSLKVIYETDANIQKIITFYPV